MPPAPTALSEALDAYVGARLSAVHDARSTLGLSDIEARALAHIGAEPGIRPSMLRDRLGVTSAGVTTLVDRLIGRGLLRRELDDQDRRVNHIHLQIDLDAEPWSALTRFSREIDRAVRAESAEATAAFAEMLQRVTSRAQIRR